METILRIALYYFAVYFFVLCISMWTNKPRIMKEFVMLPRTLIKLLWKGIKRIAVHTYKAIAIAVIFVVGALLHRGPLVILLKLFK